MKIWKTKDIFYNGDNGKMKCVQKIKKDVKALL